jgi:protein-S-isoprenylcysteine O-methyltransferase Ste14
LQDSLWSAVAESAAAQRDPVSALVVAGMNDVLNSQGYTQAAWWNRIPLGAWALMWLVAIACNLLVGYSERRTSEMALLILPSIVAVALFLIADIDSPRHGIIRVVPQNLIALIQSFKGH